MPRCTEAVVNKDPNPFSRTHQCTRTAVSGDKCRAHSIQGVRIRESKRTMSLVKRVDLRVKMKIAAQRARGDIALRPPGFSNPTNEE